MFGIFELQQRNGLQCHPAQVVPRNEGNDPYLPMNHTRQRPRLQMFHWHVTFLGEQEPPACGKIYQTGLCCQSGRSEKLMILAKRGELKQKNQGLDIVGMCSI